MTNLFWPRWWHHHYKVAERRQFRANPSYVLSSIALKSLAKIFEKNQISSRIVSPRSTIVTGGEVFLENQFWVWSSEEHWRLRSVFNLTSWVFVKCMYKTFHPLYCLTDYWTAFCMCASYSWSTNRAKRTVGREHALGHVMLETERRCSPTQSQHSSHRFPRHSMHSLQQEQFPSDGRHWHSSCTHARHKWHDTCSNEKHNMC